MIQDSEAPLVKHPTENISQAPLLLLQSPARQRMRLVSHRLSAGFPSPAADYAEDGLDLNDYLVRNKPASLVIPPANKRDRK